MIVSHLLTYQILAYRLRPQPNMTISGNNHRKKLSMVSGKKKTKPPMDVTSLMKALNHSLVPERMPLIGPGPLDTNSGRYVEFLR